LNALLDTHALLWWLSDDPDLSARARAFISNTNNSLIVSSASAWEIAIKLRIGKLPAAAELAADFVGQIDREGFQIISISAEHAIRQIATRHTQRPLRSHANRSSTSGKSSAREQ
jgi:PIN domain nuclease of toxin-antitoxin system